MAGLSTFVIKEVYFKPRTDLSINSNDLESLRFEIHHKRDKNILFSVMYRHPGGDITVFEKFLKDWLFANDKTSTSVIFAGDLDINVWDYESNKKVQYFLSIMFQCIIIPTINILICVTRNRATAIDSNAVINAIHTIE